MKYQSRRHEIEHKINTPAIRANKEIAQRIQDHTGWYSLIENRTKTAVITHTGKVARAFIDHVCFKR